MACSLLLACERGDAQPKPDSEPSTKAAEPQAKEKAEPEKTEPKPDEAEPKPDETEPQPTPNPTPTPGTMAVPKLALEVGESGLAPAPTPAKAPPLAWTFAADKTWTYDYEQRLEVETEGPVSPPNTRFLGSLFVEAKSAESADVRLELDPERSEGPNLGTLPPYEDLLRPQGGLDRAPDPLVASMLTPPAKLPALGETVTEAIGVPFNLGADKRSVAGTRSLTLLRWVECGASVCAEFDSSIRVERQIVENDQVRGELEVLATGFLVFDVAGELYWYRGATRMAMSTLAKSMGERGGLRMVQQHLHHVKRRD